MSTLDKKLLNKILTLPSDLRSQLVEELIKSLNVPIQKEIDEIWAQEAEKRVEAIKSGKIPLIDGEQVIKQMREKMNR